MSNVKDFLKRKDIVITPQRYLIEALGAMAQGLFASLLIGTIIKTLGQQTGLDVLVDLGGYATAMSGPAMACAIGWALHCPPLVLFSLITVGYSANALGGAGGPLAVLIIAIVASELGKAVSKETRVDILVTPLVTIFSGVGLSMLIAAPIGAVASQVATVLNLVLFHMLFSYMWPQIVLLDQPLRLTLKNSLNCMIAFLPHALAAALVTILFWGLVILCMPLGLLLMLVFGFWFQCEICCQIVYGDLNRVFHIEESIQKLHDAQLEKELRAERGQDTPEE